MNNLLDYPKIEDVLASQHAAITQMFRDGALLLLLDPLAQGHL